MSAAIIFLLGLLVGTIAIPVAEAAMRHAPLESPHCPYCRVPLPPTRWSATLALISGGWHCPACGKPRRWQHLLGEVGVATTWLWLDLRFGLTERTLVAMLATLPLWMITVTDLESRLIPNRIILPALVLIAIPATLWGPPVPGIEGWRWWQGPVGALLGFVAMWMLATLGQLLIGEGALGAGDVKLAAYVGFLVGYPLIIELLIVTFILGGLGGLLLLLTRRGSLRSAMPYGPYIVLATLIVLLYSVELTHWLFGG